MSCLLWPIEPDDDANLQHREACYRLSLMGHSTPWPVKPQPTEAILARRLSDNADDDLTLPEDGC